MRGKVEYDKENNELAIIELPYQTTSKKLVQEIQQCIEDGKLRGVDTVFDGSDFNGVRVCIKLTKTANTERIVKALYKETSLQSYYSINITMLKNGKIPQTYGFVEMLSEYISHAKTTLSRAYEFDLNENKNKLEILEGYAKAIANIDEIVTLIKNSKTKEIAANQLKEKFQFSAPQVKAILALQLQRLVNMEYIKIQQDIEKINKEIKALELILTDKVVFRTALENEIKRISKEYGDERRTINMTLGVDLDTEEVIEEKNLVLYFTNHGNLYVDECSTLMAQKKGGKGNKIKMDKNEVIVKSITGKNTEPLLLFTNTGRAFSLQIEDLIESSAYHLLDLEDNERIIEITPYGRAKHILFITKNGMLKKSELSIYNMTRGSVAIKLDDDDTLVRVLLADDENLAIMTHQGFFRIIETETIRPIGRLAKGVVCAKLNANDYIVDAQIVDSKATEIVTVSEDGIGARFTLSDFEVVGRVTKGKIIQKGDMAGFILISPTDKSITLSSAKSVLKVAVKDISLLNRGAIGSKIISTKDEITGVMKEI